jgi:two-component system OmpR family sensor kinase
VSGVEFVPPPTVPPTAPPPSFPPGAEDEPLPARPARRRGLGPRSLTARLVTGVVSLVLVLVIAIGASTYFALSSFLSERLDQQLQSTASGSLGQVFVDNGLPHLPVPSAQQVWAVAITTDGAVLGYSGYPGIEPLKLDASSLKRVAAAAPYTPMTVETSDGHELRVMATRPTSVTLNRTTPVSLVAVIGLSTAEEHRTLSRLVRSEVVIGGGAVLLALLATSYGVRFSLRRLRRVTTTANEVAAELSPTGAGLERRVDVPNDGTEVGQLAESMNTLLSAVETQFAARLQTEDRLRQFLADASHELRTPLTSIRGYAELARMQRAAGGNADDNLSRIESEGTRMSRLVEDLLTLARGDQSSAPRQELVDVAEMLEDAVSSARAAFPTRPIDVQLAADLHVIGDRDQLYRIVRNLIANAEMHTAAGRPVLVRCAADRDAVLIQVIDGGPGLPQAEADHVFERFWRADKARSRARGGTGLGLSIVAAMVAAHGGTVRFDSSVEHGSTVTVRLPAVSV